MPCELESFPELRGTVTEISPGSGFPSDGTASVLLRFSNGAWLQADYWRLICSGAADFSSFDHKQKYGLPAPINAIQRLQSCADKSKVMEARLDRETGDLLLLFEHDVKLQILNVTGYEVWEFHSANGRVDYSNH